MTMPVRDEEFNSSSKNLAVSAAQPRADLTRRGLLGVAPAFSFGALMAAGATPAGASVASASPLRAKYHQWQAAKDAYNTSGLDRDDPREEALIEHMVSFGGFADSFVPETVEDWAFKIIFADDDGDMSMNPHQPRLVKMAYDMVGITPRYPIEGDAA